MCYLLNFLVKEHRKHFADLMILLQVSKLAGVLVKHGVQKGDTVVIYMPMIPQAIYTMLACARIGAIHSLIFGGFASKELSTRIDHAKVSPLFGEIKQ